MNHRRETMIYTQACAGMKGSYRYMLEDDYTSTRADQSVKIDLSKRRLSFIPKGINYIILNEKPGQINQ